MLTSKFDIKTVVLILKLYSKFDSTTLVLSVILPANLEVGHLRSTSDYANLFGKVYFAVPETIFWHIRRPFHQTSGTELQLHTWLKRVKN